MRGRVRVPVTPLSADCLFGLWCVLSALLFVVGGGWVLFVTVFRIGVVSLVLLSGLLGVFLRRIRWWICLLVDVLFLTPR